MKRPSSKAEKPKPKFGTLKGKAILIDPHALDPMTDKEVDAFIEGRTSSKSPGRKTPTKRSQPR